MLRAVLLKSRNRPQDLLGLVLRNLTSETHT
jgi:hypothetical protein